MSGLTPEGFVAKRTAELKIELERALVERFGAVNLNPSSVFGQLVGVLVDQQTDHWNRLEEVYWSQYPDSATGVNLDRVVSINGLQRLPARATAVRAVVGGTHSTQLAAGRLAGSTITGEHYNLVAPVTISTTASVGARLVVSTVANNENYEISLGGVPYQINSGALATEASILTMLRGELPSWVRTNLVTGALQNYLDLEYDTPLTILVGTRLSTPLVYNYAEFVGARPGPIALPAHGLDQIVTPVAGWTSIDNRTPGSDGRNIESDTELRARRQNSLRLFGQNTLEAVTSHLQQVPGVLALRVVANNGTSVDAEGIPRQHVRAIVDGGDPDEIARVLFDYVAAGIGYYGQEEVAVPSLVTNRSYAVKFDRPTNVPWYATVVIQASSSTPTDTVELVRALLMEYSKGLNIADPVLYTRLFTPINQVIGEGAYVSELYINTVPIDEPEDQKVVNIVPEPDERLVLDPSRISVFVVQ